MCCQSGECRSGLSLISLQLTLLTLHLATLQLALTVAPARLTTNMTTSYHSLQLVVMRRNGYKNSNWCYAEASFTLHGLHTNGYDSSAFLHKRPKPLLTLRGLIDPLDLPCYIACWKTWTV